MMNDELFADFVQSVREGGAILRGETPASRRVISNSQVPPEKERKKRKSKRQPAPQDTTEKTASSDPQTSNSVAPTIFKDSVEKTINETAQHLNGVATGLGVTGGQFAVALSSLPQNVADLAREMPAVARRMKRAGMRSTSPPRSEADILKLFNKIPATSKLGRDPQTAIRQFLKDRHASHIESHRDGGSSEASNIVWELGRFNIRRGAKTMTDTERVLIRVHNALDSVLRNSGTLARMGLKVTLLATLSQVIVVALAYSLDLYRGDITVEEYKKLLLETAKSVGLSTPVFFLLFVAVLALLPEFAVLLSAPVVVAGFNVLAGLSMATPIIQSLIRHTEAGGLGDETNDRFQQLRDNLQIQVDAWVQRGGQETPVAD